MNSGEHDTARRVYLRGIAGISPGAATLADVLWIVADATTSTDRIAREIGYGNRHALARALRVHRLPSCATLTRTATVLRLVAAVQDGDVSLPRIALAGGKEPAHAYRLIRRMTGLTWRAVLPLPLDEVLDRMMRRWPPGTRPLARAERHRALA